MATYKVKHSCNHIEEHSLHFCSQKEQDRKISWLGTQPCWECRKAARYDEDIALRILVEPMLTSMMGTPKTDGEDNAVRDAARDYALREIKKAAKHSRVPPSMEYLEEQTESFIEGYRQALEDVSKRGE